MAKIGKIGKNRPDLDDGKLYERILVDKEKAGKTLDCGKEGEQIIEVAIRAAKKYHII